MSEQKIVDLADSIMIIFEEDNIPLEIQIAVLELLKYTIINSAMAACETQQ